MKKAKGRSVRAVELDGQSFVDSAAVPCRGSSGDGGWAEGERARERHADSQLGAVAALWSRQVGVGAAAKGED